MTTLLAYKGGGNVLRIAFPAVALGLAYWFININRKDCYIELIIWLFLLTPFYRRLVDNNVGFAQVNLLMLAPYCASLVSIPIVINKLIVGGHNNLQMPFFLIFAAIFYSFMVMMFLNFSTAGIYDAITWVSPVCVGLMIANEPENFATYQRIFLRALFWGTIVTGTYGVYQFVVAPAWDNYWIINADMGSVGSPMPFMIRVFSTLNSPGSFGGITALALLILLPNLHGVKLLAIAPGVSALLLSMYRTSWLGFAVGLVYLYINIGSERLRSTVIMSTIGIIVVVGVLFQIPQISDVLSERFNSFSSIQQDASYSDRSGDYINFFTSLLEDAPIGRGFGSTGVRVSFVSGNSNATLIDSAVISIWQIFGGIFGTVLLSSVLVIVIKAITAGRYHTGEPFITACVAALIAATSMLIGMNTISGEMGTFFWMTVGFCLAAHSQAQSPRSFAY
jgi:hypothetical protein